jgi:hypothetical protein
MQAIFTAIAGIGAVRAIILGDAHRTGWSAIAVVAWLTFAWIIGARIVRGPEPTRRRR